MSVDLRNNSMFGRIGLIVLDDCVVKLEHGRTQDRVRRFMFESVESVIVWRRVPWLHVILCVTFLVLPGLLMFLTRNSVAIGIGLSVATLGVLLVFWYLYAKRTTIRIVRASKTDDIDGIFRPGKMRRFLNRFLAGVQRVQQLDSAAEAPPIPGVPPVVVPPNPPRTTF